MAIGKFYSPCLNFSKMFLDAIHIDKLPIFHLSSFLAATRQYFGSVLALWQCAN